MNLEDIKIDDSKITEDQLEALYIYLSMTYDTMDEEEKKVQSKLRQAGKTNSQVKKDW